MMSAQWRQTSGGLTFTPQNRRSFVSFVRFCLISEGRVQGHRPLLSVASPFHFNHAARPAVSNATHSSTHLRASESDLDSGKLILARRVASAPTLGVAECGPLIAKEFFPEPLAISG